ncbi:flagellar hook-length control protein FliK [Pseudomonas sp. LRF_L74]|uniref:flagellar hook-length control protein FliK n=1 Tax=Pseudomonas sp. LRF_L74 TaxID=3369422 RepID=UPI003F5DFB13
MAEIGSSLPVAPSSSTSRATVSAADLAVKLLKPLDGLMVAGETADAEVVSVKESSANSFQLLLKLTLDSGRQTIVEAAGSRALALGSNVTVTALSTSRLGVALQASATQALTSIDLEQLPVGTQLQGKVVATQSALQNGAQVVYKALVSLLNTPLAGNKLSIESPVPLPLGSLLTAQVKGDQSLSFMPLSGRLDQLALGQQMATQQGRQGSLEGLFKALQGTAGNDMPADVRGSIDKLLALLPDGEQLSTEKGLAKALENSGLFLEGKLLSGQAAALPQDLKANLLRLIAQLLPNLPNLPTGTPPPAAALAQALPALMRNALGNLGQSSLRQQAMSFPLPSRLLQSMDEEADLQTVLRLAAAAVSRLQTHQLSSLAQNEVTPDGNLLTTWQLELPMRSQHDIVPLQIRLQREEEQGKGGTGKQDKKEILWRIDLAFDLAPLGPLQVQAQVLQGRFSSQLWAENGQTVALVERELGHLRERLSAAGLEVDELACRQGTPPRGPKTHLEQRWVDETA